MLLCSTGFCQLLDFTGLLHLSGSTTDFHPSGCALSLQSFCSVSFPYLRLYLGLWLHCLHPGLPSPHLHLGPVSLQLQPWPSRSSVSPRYFVFLALPGSLPPLAPPQSVVSLVLPGRAPLWLLPPMTPLWVCILALIIGIPPWFFLLPLRPGFSCLCFHPGFYFILLHP